MTSPPLRPGTRPGTAAPRLRVHTDRRASGRPDRSRRPDRRLRRSGVRALDGSAERARRGQLRKGPDGRHRQGSNLGLRPAANPRRRRPRHPDQPGALDRRRSRVAQVSRSSARTSAARARPYAQARATDGRPRGRPSGPPQERPPTRRTRRRSAPQVAIDEESITVTVPVQLPDLNGNAAKLLLAILVELASVDLLDRDSEEPVDDCQR